MNFLTRSRWSRALAALGAVALAATSCGSAATESSVETTLAAANPAADASPATEPDAESSTAPAPTEPPDEPTSAPSEADVAAAPADAEAEVVEEATEAPAAESGRAPIELLSADAAIANAEININNLATPEQSQNVLDIEVLAVADGSIQTLRDVVVGDRPVGARRLMSSSLLANIKTSFKWSALAPKTTSPSPPASSKPETCRHQSCCGIQAS